MAKASDFLDYIAPHAVDAPEDILLFQIQEAVTDFLIDTKLATDYIRINMDEFIHDYILDTPECHTLLSIKRVLIGERCAETVDWAELKATTKPERYGYYADIDNEGEPMVWIGTPCGKSDIEVEYSYTTGRGACEIPQFVLNKYARVIQYYALSKVYGITGQDWSNAQLSIHYMQQYEREISKIKRTTRKVEGGKLKSRSFIGNRSCFGCGGFFR